MAKPSFENAGDHFTAVDSFSGAGGLSLGLAKAGFRIAGAFDKDPGAVETYKRNLGHPCWIGDVEEVDGKAVLNQCGVDKLDLFAGGPPCQGFSKQKRGAHLGDERNHLVLEFSRLVREISPKFFLLEQVAIFGQKRGMAFLAEIVRELSNYKLYPHLYNSAEYGLAQRRERFVIVGKRRDIGPDFEIPGQSKRSVTVRDAIGDLPPPPKDYSIHPDYPNHQAARVTEANVNRFSYVPPGGGWQNIPMEMRLNCHQIENLKSGGWPDVYGRLEWDSQCPTITGGFDSFTRGRYGHPEQNRPLTPREAARIQGFPDSFCFIGTRADIRRQIGNAVPPPLAEAIGRQIVRALSSDDGSRPTGLAPELLPWQRTLDQVSRPLFQDSDSLSD